MPGPAVKNAVIEAKGLTVKYGNTIAVNDVSFVVEKGDYVGLAGPNGSGKSSLVKAILGLTPVSSGSVRLFGQLRDSSFGEWRRIGYLPQTSSSMNPLFPATVGEAVLMGALAAKRFPRRLTAQDSYAANKAMRELGVHDLRKRLVSELSGGQRQRVMLARALINSPELLVMDEPSTGLDPEARDDFFGLVGELNRKKGVTIIMITHDTGQIGHYAKTLLYLDRRIIFHGSFDSFCMSEDVEKEFGEFAHHLICHQHHPHHPPHKDS